MRCDCFSLVIRQPREVSSATIQRDRLGHCRAYGVRVGGDRRKIEIKVASVMPAELLEFSADCSVCFGTARLETANGYR